METEQVKERIQAINQSLIKLSAAQKQAQAQLAEINRNINEAVGAIKALQSFLPNEEKPEEKPNADTDNAETKD